MSEPVVAVRDLFREYKTTVGLLRRKPRIVNALNGISFDVQPGEIFGMVGPNGAGKTTLIKILATLLLPTSGTAQVLGYDVVHHERRIRQHINFILGGERGLYWRLSGYDNLRYFADLYRLDRATAETRCKDLLTLVGLWDRHDERVEGYSKGMKQRLHIAKALINEPRVLFLDEPTIGLDPLAARMLRELISEIRSRGITIFLTSHYMWEMEILCDRLAVLCDGKIITLDSPANLKNHVNGLEVVELQVLGTLDEVADRLRARPYIDTVSLSSSGHAQTIRVQTDDAQATISEIRQSLPGIDLSRLVVRPPNLEDAYIKLVGGES